MELTSDNFKDRLSSIREEILECDLIAIDWELTGLHLVSDRAAAFETLQEHFEKHKRSVEHFLPNQFGLALYKFNPQNQSYDVRVYNIYIFPRPFKSYDVTFTTSAGSLDFLAQNKFDFNKWIHKGVPFLPKFEEEKFKKETHERYFPGNILGETKRDPTAGNGGRDYKMNVGAPELEFLAGPWKIIEEWLANPAAEKEFILPSFNAYQRRLLYQEIPTKFPNVMAQSFESPEGMATIKLTRFDNPEQMRALLEQQYQQRMSEVEDAVGFRKIVDLIVESKKPVVGHNCLLDLFHLYSRFIGRLPQTIGDWKQSFNSSLNLVFDTKLIVQLNEGVRSLLDNIHLGSLHSRIKSAPFTEIPHYFSEGFDRYREGGTFHEAGYDAYVTGVVFLTLANHITGEMDLSAMLEDSDFQIYKNKVNIHAMPNSFLNFAGNDRTPVLENVMFVGPYAKATTTKDLNDHFRKYNAKYRLKWRNDESAFLEFDAGVLTAELSRQLVDDSQTSPYKVQPYEAWAHPHRAPLLVSTVPMEVDEAATNANNAKVESSSGGTPGRPQKRPHSHIVSSDEPQQSSSAEKKARKE